MTRCLILMCVFAVGLVGKAEPGRFEGIWKTEPGGPLYAALTILSEPPRGTLARSEGGIDLYIQDVRIVKGVLRFKTIDPNDGLVQYELRVDSAKEATLSIGGKVRVVLKRR